MRGLCVFVFAGGLLLALGCQPAQEPEVDLAAEEQAIREVLDKCVQGWNERDIELFGSTLAQDENLIIFGYGYGGEFFGWEAVKAAVEEMFTMFSDSNLTVSDLRVFVTPDGNHAWAACYWDWEATMGEAPLKLTGGRWTMVFEKREAGWVMVQYHDSLGWPTGEEAEPEAGE
jgi:ketosteroid isomerase-like protein